MDNGINKPANIPVSPINGQPIPTGGGRPKGSPNKATTQAREAIALFVEGNVDRLNGWLDAIAEDSPKDAFDRFMAVVEYHVPKLSRAEQQQLDKDGNKADAGFNININHVNAQADKP